MFNNILGQILLFSLLFLFLSVWRHQRCQDLATLKFYQLTMLGILNEKPFNGEVSSCGKIFFLKNEGSITFSFILVLPLFLLIFIMSLLESRIISKKIDQNFKTFVYLKKMKKNLNKDFVVLKDKISSIKKIKPDEP